MLMFLLNFYEKYISLYVFIKIIEVFVILAVNYVLHISFNIRTVSIGTENKLTLYNITWDPQTVYYDTSCTCLVIGVFLPAYLRVCLHMYYIILCGHSLYFRVSFVFILIINMPLTAALCLSN